MKSFFIYILSLTIPFIGCNNPVEEDNGILVIGTFNIEWLGDGINDRKDRTEDDYDRIKSVLEDLNFDILGLQEIENETALRKVIDTKKYDYYISNNGGQQNLAFVYRKVIKINSITDYSPLVVEESRTRPGIAMNFKYDEFDAVLLVVHLKSTSRYDNTDSLKEASRYLRNQQANVIKSFIDSIQQTNEKDIIVLGDFNDYPDRKENPTLTPLKDEDLNFLSSDFGSCKYDYLNGIDHILITSNIRKRYLDESARVYDIYSSYSDIDASNISDHCPILANFNSKMKDDD